MSLELFNTAYRPHSVYQLSNFKYDHSYGSIKDGALNEDFLEDGGSSSFLPLRGLTGIITSLVGLIRITFEPTPEPSPDIFTLLPLRLLGYGFAVDEALRYGNAEEYTGPLSFLASCFMISHCFYRGCIACMRCEGTYMAILLTPEQRWNRSVFTFCATLLYEVVVSYFCPPVITTCICRFTDTTLEVLGVGSEVYRRWTPVVFGIAMMPMIGLLVDRAVQNLITKAVYPLYTKTMEIKM